MAKTKFDFSGYATKADLKCSDGRIIRKDAFKHNDGQIVPLVWQHIHDSVSNVLGHALLENRADGVYAYCAFNDTEAGKTAKALVQHGDIHALSIHANKLQQQGQNVLHGEIREVSLVLAGANPGAFIDNLQIQHGDGTCTNDETEAIIFADQEISLTDIEHDDTKVDPVKETKVDPVKETKVDPVKVDPAKETAVQHAATDKTVQEVFDSMNEEQKTVFYAMVSQAIADNAAASTATHSDTGDDITKDDKTINHSNKGGNSTMKRNIFDKQTEDKDSLKHAEEMAAIFADVKRYGSLKDSAISHGVTNIDYLFPDAQTIDGTPQFIKRDTGWVAKVMSSVHHTPFSRIKSILADITADDARAKGYIKGKEKIDEVFSLLKRTTSPTTIYKKQKLDRDDVIDITDFDVVAWIKTEMRMMLDEEIARALLIGDGRLNASDDKINEQCLRPIWTDADLYSVKVSFNVAVAATEDDMARSFIKSTIKARKNYKGSGDPTLYMTEDMLTNCLLLEDTTGRMIYDSVAKLATTLRVKEIITVPVMENKTRTVGADTMTLHGIVVNLDDYNVGADKGGAVNMFDDFDIDFNAQKYLIETRASGALTKPYAALVIESKPGAVG